LAYKHNYSTSFLSYWSWITVVTAVSTTDWDVKLYSLSHSLTHALFCGYFTYIIYTAAPSNRK